jgi:hypothetical protein
MAATPLRLSPFCKHLASKKIRLAARPPMNERDVLDASNRCWCAKTSQVRGPDREIADPEACRKGRACFESSFADLL